MDEKVSIPKPVGDKILAEFKKTTETASGIILPERTSKVEDEKAVVLAVGTDSDIIVKEGDEIIFNPHAAMVVDLKGKEYILLTQKAIICITNYDRDGR